MAEVKAIEHHDDSDLNDHRIPWTSDPVECVDCGYVWIAVHALGADMNNLECSACGSFNSDLHDPVNAFYPAPLRH